MATIPIIEAEVDFGPKGQESHAKQYENSFLCLFPLPSLISFYTTLDV